MTNQSAETVLITGGSSGIGLALARQMAARGDTVIICGRSAEKLAAASLQIPQLTAIQCDITRAEDRADLHREIAARFAGLSMLVNNAGVAQRYLLAQADDLEGRIVAEWQTNFLAPVLLTRQLLPQLTVNRGTVVNVSSGLAYAPLAIEPSYCASKAALHSMTQSMRVQLADLGVRVVEIFYPAVDTPFQAGHAPANAMQPEEAAAIALRGLSRGKAEIRVGMANSLFIISRLMPARAVRLLNRSMPGYVRQLLAQE